MPFALPTGHWTLRAAPVRLRLRDIIAAQSPQPNAQGCARLCHMVRAAPDSDPLPEKPMSDALDYLLKARPEAMTHYFRFVREAGRHLDPKTRALISVITKVHAQTEAGFRQYLRRALKEGASAAEILDAMLMAFPALGLTRIVWAIDVLLRMDLPEFRIDALQRGAQWRGLGAEDRFAVGMTVAVESDGLRAFVHRTEAEFLVYEARCPHRGTALPASALAGTRLTCPGHDWVYDTTDGRCVAGGEQALRRLPNRVVAGELQAYL